MQEPSIPKVFQTLISSVEDFHVRHSVQQEKEPGSRTPEVPCSLKLPDWLKHDDLRICCLKMYPDCYRMTGAGHLRPSSARWMTWGIMWNGWCLTARISGYPNQESGCSLSAILIPDAPEKYFLSQKQLEKLLYQSSRDRKDTASMTQKDLPVPKQPIQEDLEEKQAYIS